MKSFTILSTLTALSAAAPFFAIPTASSPSLPVGTGMPLATGFPASPSGGIPIPSNGTFNGTFPAARGVVSAAPQVTGRAVSLGENASPYKREAQFGSGGGLNGGGAFPSMSFPPFPGGAAPTGAPGGGFGGSPGSGSGFGSGGAGGASPSFSLPAGGFGGSPAPTGLSGGGSSFWEGFFGSSSRSSEQEGAEARGFSSSPIYAVNKPEE